MIVDKEKIRMFWVVLVRFINDMVVGFFIEFIGNDFFKFKFMVYKDYIYCKV